VKAKKKSGGYSFRKIHTTFKPNKKEKEKKKKKKTLTPIFKKDVI